MIREGDLLPGDCVSADQFEYRIKGRLLHTKEKEDHTSSMISIYNQVSLGASDSIRSKKEYESKISESGVTVKSYMVDNGVYTQIYPLVA